VLLLLNPTPEAKRLLGRPRPRWETDITMDLKEMEWEDMDWICLALY
jgi:hypothetical protein